MNVLIIGSGAREHAIAWKISKSTKLKKLCVIPGNPGITEIAHCIDVAVNDFEGILKICKSELIDLVIVGPEEPLCLGLVDFLTLHGIRVFGPHKKAARLEGSKAFAKDFMLRHHIPTAKYQRFTDVKLAKEALDTFTIPVVIKADGLAAGKGVVIAQDKKEAEEAIDAMLLHHVFGEAGNAIIIEEFLTGIEASQLCFVSKNTLLPLDGSQDYKRAYDDDKGLNTGGMGNYSPSRLYTDEVKQMIDETILTPFINGLKADGITYTGIIFVGLMIKDNKAKVIEFNVRFGDPEAECLLVRLENDLLDIIENAMNNTLDKVKLSWTPQHSVVLVLASGGYPKQYEKGKRIEGLKDIEDAIVFHGGTAIRDGEIITNGGRVLALTTLGDTLEKARSKAYLEADKITFEGKAFRSDIAK